MKRFFGFALVCALLSFPAFASGNSQTVSIPSTVQVGSTQLPAGNYKVTWTGTGANVQVTLAGGGVQPVTVPAKIVEEKHNQTGVVTNTIGGKDILEELLLSKVGLVL